MNRLTYTWGHRITTNLGSYQFYLNDDLRGSINGSTGAWGAHSDARLKENFQIIDNPLSKIRQLGGYYYHWKENAHEDVGLIAQEVQHVFPQLVEESEEGYLVLHPTGLIGPVIEAIKELDDITNKNRKKFEMMQKGIERRVETLERQVASLEKELNELRVSSQKKIDHLQEENESLKKDLEKVMNQVQHILNHMQLD